MTAQPLVKPAAPDQVDWLALIREGMDVYDADGHKVGRVDGIYAGAADESRPPAATTVAPVPLAVTNPQPAPMIGAVSQPISRVPEFDDVLEPEADFPRELRDRLMHDGFIRIDAGFLHHHRYALRDQIKRVDGDSALLNVGAHELFKH